MFFEIPDYVNKILKTLNDANFAAYIVGGCVRDAFMGKEPSDWDICTSAKPEEIKTCFPGEKTVDTGIRHGTVSIVTGGGIVEVTTYRVDGDYKDGRHPSSVAFTSCIEEDLARRDFTVNAMAFHPEKGLVDPYGGRNDLAKKQLVCVGDGETRFDEDGLRIMRGLRFASVLDFDLTEETERAMEKKIACLDRISAERINVELSKLLLGCGVDRIMTRYSALLKSAVGGICPGKVEHLPKDLVIRLAVVFPDNTEEWLKALKYSRQVVKEASAISRLLKQKSPENRMEIKKLLSREGKHIAGLYCTIIGRKPLIEEILLSGECWSLQQLAVDGQDLLAEGVEPGRQMGRLLYRLLQLVIEEKLDNRRETLIKYIHKQVMEKEDETMRIEKVWVVSFSPTGQTELVGEHVGTAAVRMLKGAELEVIDVTPPAARERRLVFGESDLVIFCTPTYAGRVPNKIMPYYRDCIEGNGALAAAVVTYGNRSYDDSLMELSQLAVQNEFSLIGCGAFVCQHAFAETLAIGRPDEDDLRSASALGRGIAEKIISGSLCKPEKIPGNDPIGPYYVPKGTDGQPAVFLKAKPVTDHEKCVACGLCAKSCPMGSIDAEQGFETTGICIKCQACVRKCPMWAKSFVDEAFQSHRQMLKENYAGGDKKPEIFL